VEFILEILLTAVVEGLLSVTGELLLELGFQSAGEAFTRRSRAHPVLAFGGIAMLGALTGLATALLLPARILQPSPVPGGGSAAVATTRSWPPCGAAPCSHSRWRWYDSSWSRRAA
jgi:hypothetical protein